MAVDEAIDGDFRASTASMTTSRGPRTRSILAVRRHGATQSVVNAVFTGLTRIVATVETDLTGRALRPERRHARARGQRGAVQLQSHHASPLQGPLVPPQPRRARFRGGV